MKKFTIFCIIILISSTIQLNAQSDYHFKEKYDNLSGNKSNEKSYTDDNSKWWYSWGPLLHSFISMYEATGDKAYLFLFVDHSCEIIQKQEYTGKYTRHWDMIPITQETFYTADLMLPMAEFVHLIKNDYDLYCTKLPDGLINYKLEGMVMLGFGDYSNWVLGRLMQTLNDQFIKYWLSDEMGFGRHHDDYGLVVAEINQQAAYGPIMYYIGKYYDPVSDFYMERAESIARILKDLLITQDNSRYVWKHNEFYVLDPIYDEDVCHAINSLVLAHWAEKVNIGYPNYFEPYHMQKFINTFNNNIYKNDDWFSDGVYGMNSNLSEDQKFECGNNVININDIPDGRNYYWANVFGWIMLDEYSSDDLLYNRLSQRAISVLENQFTNYAGSNYCSKNTSNLQGTSGFYGLSEIVKAQWKRNVTNLMLTNRIVNHDQDFEVGGTITIDPKSAIGKSIAYPYTTEKIFKVENGVNVNMNSGTKIILKPGFIAERGSNYTASIDPSLIETQLKYSMNTSSESVEIVHSKDIEEKLKIEEVLNIYPNPFTSSINISFQLKKQSDVRVEVLDILGKMVISDMLFNNVSNIYYNIGTSDLKNGIYICRVWIDNILMKKEKIMKLE